MNMPDRASSPLLSKFISSKKLTNWKFINLVMMLFFLVIGTLYIGKTWSPSSYGHILVDSLGYRDSGPDLGKARPIRSDEWAVVTPLTQATINNGFERQNRTSFYSEDLRINYGLPIMDWGFIFKPTMWLYGLTNPAYAYSAHWFALFTLFIFGYAWLFRWLGATPVIAFTLATGLYFTGFVQFWWNEKGPIFAIFPWVLLPFATRLPLIWKGALFYWIAVTWLLTNFYPPVQVSLAFVGLVILLAREPGIFKTKTLLWLILAAILAAGTTALYLWDYLQETSKTLYPGERIVSGGAVPWRFWLSWVFPPINFTRFYESLIGYNICEIGTIGLYYTMLVMCFLDYSRWRQGWDNSEYRHKIIVFGVGLAMMLAWMALPLPSWVGAPLLWNHVQPSRMQYASGVLLLCFLLVLVNTLGLRITFFRLAIFFISIVFGWWTWKFDAHKIHFEDLVILAFAVITFLFVRRRPGIAHTGLALASLLAGFLLFGRFNPLQSAWPIFNHSPNQTIKAFDQLAADNTDVLAVTGLPGAIGNGLGYRSVSHVTAVPKLEFWRKQFPDLPDNEFEMIFNRYSHIILSDEAKPRLYQADAIMVPLKLFQKQEPAPIRQITAPISPLEHDGSIDFALVETNHLILKGWGGWTGPSGSHELEISIKPPATGPVIRKMMVRSDLPYGTANRISAINGFSLRVPLGTDSKITELCLVAHDTSTGNRTLLPNPPNLPYCQQYQRIK